MSDERMAGVWQRFFGFWLFRFRSRAVCISGETVQHLKSPENHTVLAQISPNVETNSQMDEPKISQSHKQEAKSTRAWHKVTTTPLRHKCEKCHNKMRALCRAHCLMQCLALALPGQWWRIKWIAKRHRSTIAQKTNKRTHFKVCSLLGCFGLLVLSLLTVARGRCWAMVGNGDFGTI